MSTALNNNSTRSRVPGTVAISDDQMRRFAPSVFASQPIEGVSERYSFLPTSSILNGMRENGWVPVRAQEQSIRTEARRGFQKHVVRFARVEHLQTWEKNQVRPEVVLVNSHDKSSAYQLHCGLFRLVCTNGMVVSDGTFQRISIKHSGFNPDSVIEASFKALNAVPDIMNKVQLFQDRILTIAAIVLKHLFLGPDDLKPKSEGLWAAIETANTRTEAKRGLSLNLAVSLPLTLIGPHA